MFCFQCEQTARGTGCTDLSSCGKDHTTAGLQDLLVYVTKGVAMYAHRARLAGVVDKEVDLFVLEALFTTVTNVNFDYADVKQWVLKGSEVRAKAKGLYEGAVATPEKLSGAASYEIPTSMAGMVAAGANFGVPAAKAKHGEDIASLVELYVYGLKGAAAYAVNAMRVGKQSDEHFARYLEALAYLGDNESYDFNELLGRCLAAGEINLEAMALLDDGNTSTFGHPVPTEVRVEPVKGKAIVVSGHDLWDLEALLKQTEGKGINVYTHGEMLPAHGYPGLNKYKHLVGNYGGAWQDQQTEFAEFPGAVLMTTNCIVRPKNNYIDRVFISGLVAWPGLVHVDNKDFSAVIDAALAAPGFTEDGAAKKITVGFARNAVLGAADTVVEAVKSGAIKHFFLIGGCDGAKSGRNYYTEFAEQVPDDCMILTLACGKYRFNKKDFGSIGGLPRLLDVGQCNDAYSAIQIAVALSEAFECGVNDLPLSMIVSWFEQKAVAILLTLLHLGIKGVRIGPSLPAFISPKVLGILVEKFDLKASTTAEADLKAILQPAAA